MDLKEMTVDELKNLSLDIKEELNKRIRDIKQAQVEVNRILDKTYTFYFKTECNVKNKGYVARCTYGKKGIERYFYNLQEIRLNFIINTYLLIYSKTYKLSIICKFYVFSIYT